MQCRNCGTDIADKAIVCYRCGHPTTDPVRRAVPAGRTRTPIASIIAGAVMLLLAAYATYVSQTAVDPDRWHTIAGVLAGAGVMVIVLGLLRRRR
jgi:hypothetical protein